MADKKAEESPTKPASESAPKPVDKIPDQTDSGIAEIIPPEIISGLRTLGVDPGDPSVSKAVKFSLLMFGGPIPPPSFLAEYNKVVPGLAEKIVSWTEQQRDTGKR